MICAQYRCLFVHVPKTAGMSIDQVFLELVGLTWKTRAPLLLGGNDDPKLGPPRLEHLKGRRGRESPGGVRRKIREPPGRFSTRCARIGIPPTPLPRVNRSLEESRPKTLGELPKQVRRAIWSRERQHTFPQYTDYYDDKSREFVGRLFRKDVEAFNYAFGDRVRSAAPAPS